MTIGETLRDEATREAHKLVDVALAVAALGNMFSREARMAAALFIADEARRLRNGAGYPEEAKVLMAMASYFIGQNGEEGT